MAITPLTPPISGLVSNPTDALATRSASLLGKNRSISSDQIAKLSQDFESAFLSQMLEPMFNSENSQWFGGGESEDAYRMLMVRQFGTVIAKSGGIGIADMVKKELLQLQEVQSAPANEPTVKGT